VEGMVSYWKFDEGSGTIAYDSVGGNHGTLVNGPVWTTGQIDGALSFDGVNDYVTTRNFDYPAATIMGWFKANDVIADQYVIAQDIEYANCGDFVISVGQTIDNKILAMFDRRGCVENNYFTLSCTVNPGTWYFVAVTMDDSKTELYINGNLIDTGPRFPYLGDSGAILDIGGYRIRPVVPFNGVTDEVAIYNRTLTSEEIQQHYQNGLNGVGYLAIEAAIDIKPETLNLSSKGKFTVLIDLPEGYDEEDIDISTVQCEGANALKGMMADDGRLVAKFDRQDLEGVSPGDAVELTVTGELADGTPFEGSDTIRVIDKGGKKK